MQNRIINLGIVDDHTLFRKMLVEFLYNEKHFQVNIQASNVPELFDKLRHYPIDILLIDIFMPEFSGISAIKFIKKEYPEVKVIVLSMCADLAMINDLADIGIHAFVSKCDEPSSLIQAIDSVSNNMIYKNKLFTEALYWSIQRHAKRNVEKTQIVFDEREKKVLQLLWEEKSNKEIANEIFLGVRSVEKIRQDMKEKLGVKSTIGLLKYALENKIIEIERALVEQFRVR
jgi:DNA-binding NarL/FixJ family response regulator